MSAAHYELLREITTATITTMLLKKGIRRCWMNGPKPLVGLTFVGWQEPIGCGGCAVFPGDVIVCDDDGAVVIPQNLVAFVAEEGAEHERMETWIVGEVERGAKLPGLYPMNEETSARYEAAKKNLEH
jgi:regulator of RNase E activity RraA